MNWELISALSSVLTLVGTLLVVSHSQGKHTQMLVDVKEDVGDCRKDIDKHTAQLGEHGKEIGQLQTAVWPESWHRV